MLRNAEDILGNLLTWGFNFFQTCNQQVFCKNFVFLYVIGKTILDFSTEILWSDSKLVSSLFLRDFLFGNLPQQICHSFQFSNRIVDYNFIHKNFLQ